MPITPPTKPTGRPKGAVRRSAIGQLSKLARELLLYLRQEEQMGHSMKLGIPWKLKEYADFLVVHPSALSRTLTNLETRGLVWCLNTGEGRGRRVSHVRLSAQARLVAEIEGTYHMSLHQLQRASKKARDEARETAQNAAPEEAS